MTGPALLLRFESPSGDYTLTFEDDGRVAYAYLQSGSTIVGDVWLYNRCATPSEVDWSDPSLMPFANPQEFVSEEAQLSVAVEAKDVRVDWNHAAHSAVVRVFIFGDVFGVVGVGDKPGYARLAVRDGPLAKVLDDRD